MFPDRLLEDQEMAFWVMLPNNGQSGCVAGVQAIFSAVATNRAGLVKSGRRFRTDGSIVLNSRISCSHSSGVERLSAPPSVERRSLARAFVSARMINRR